ncbi:sulfuric ester hydrolase [Aureococcus anophagefferens]|nr:sulfuric ester hydrolase [Aureococcus anophagefferens]
MSEHGFVLDNFYAAPTCTPSRAMLMTGRYNIRNGMQDSVIHSTEPRGVPLDERFLSQKLSDAGYRTAAIGKWHLGMHRDAYTPLKRGFDLFYGILTGGGSHTGHFSVSQPFTVRGQSETTIWQGYNLWENGQVSPDNYGTTHSTHLYTAKAKEYIEAFESEDFSLDSFFAVPEVVDAKKGDAKKGDAKKGDDKKGDDKKDAKKDDAKKGGAHRRLAASGKAPWFVYLSYQAVHDPVTVGDDRYVSETACANVTEASPASRHDSAISTTNRPTLCGMIAEIDDGLKTLRLSLENAQAWAQTIFVVLSDNGGVRAHGSANYPLRGEKAQYYEGGVKVPAVLAGGYVEEALRRAGGAERLRSASLAHITDVHATFLSLAGYEGGDDDKPLDGVSLFSHLVQSASGVAGAAPPRSDVLININSALFAGSGAIRVGDHKLMVNPEPNESSIYSKSIVAQAHKDALGAPSISLFDLKKNPYERTDCATSDPAESCNLYDVAAYADAHYFGLLAMEKDGDAADAAAADDAKDFAARYQATESALAVDARAVAAAPAGLSTGLVALVSFFVGAVLSNKLMDPRKRGRVELP